MNNKQSLPTGFIIAAIAILVLIIGGASYAIYQSNNDNDDTNNDTSMVETTEEENPMVEEEVVTDNTPDLAPLVGSYTGSSSLLTSSLVFPESTFSLSEDGSVVLTASGLNLAAFGNPALQVQGAYPDVTIAANAMAIPQADGSVLMDISSLVPVFSVNGTQLDVVTSQALAQGLASAGIVVPVVSPAQPLMVGTIVQLSADGSISIINTADSEVAISFNGTRQ